MSPWGKFYLMHVQFRIGFHEPFEHWRMHFYINHIADVWAPIDSRLWRKIENHLDLVVKYLRN
jgi:hypothetical protein